MASSSKETIVVAALGFPTANLEPVSASVPPDGVYAGYTTRADGTRHLSAISVGTRPHYYGDDAAVIVESHLIDFDGDLYGERLAVEIDALIREQARLRIRRRAAGTDQG